MGKSGAGSGSALKTLQASRGHTVGGIRFGKAPNAEKDYLMRASISKLDRILKRDQSSYVGYGGTGAAKPGAYKNAVFFLAKAKAKKITVDAPRMFLDKQGAPVIQDGRHRFAALRDNHGVTDIYVTVPRRQAQRFRKRFGAD